MASAAALTEVLRREENAVTICREAVRGMGVCRKARAGVPENNIPLRPNAELCSYFLIFFAVTDVNAPP